ncbi:uncharacterized protein N7503_006999 [Penicillium pulvis]|uniref:uncharacterized protein n=1 Tax=Penicillium pulvis TaxID=1562058 RepID=UPI00254665E5|nr:uncharacterized protein N7503_006999 [Penicillium pulvis]KAJ5797703.1 hypothetical protein N7503_006999 [Penicillium pulvis]
MRANREPLPPPSLMVRKFLDYEASDDTKSDLPASIEPPESGWPRMPFRSGYFFLYGSLMDPLTLTRVLQLSDPPRMRPARVVGYEIKYWGRNSALVDGEPFQPVDGFACEILCREHWDRLVAYMADHYDVGSISIDFIDTRETGVEGVAFHWRGYPEELRDDSLNLET